MKSFKDMVTEVVRGNFTSPTAGQTWSPAANAEPYKSMSGPIGAGGANPPGGGQDLVDDLDIPKHLPFPLVTITDQLATAYLSLSQIEMNIKSALRFNPTIKGTRREVLEQQLETLKLLMAQAKEMKEEIKDVADKIDTLSLNNN